MDRDIWMMIVSIKIGLGGENLIYGRIIIDS